MKEIRLRNVLLIWMLLAACERASAGRFPDSHSVEHRFATAQSDEAETSGTTTDCGRMTAELKRRNDDMVSGDNPGDRALFDALSTQCEKTFERDMQLAGYVFSRGRFAEAESMLEGVDASSSQEPERLFLLFVIRLNRNPESALEIAAQARKRYPQDPYTKAMIGTSLCLTNQCASALDDLVEANKHIRNLSLLAVLGISYVENEEYAQAAALFDVIRSKKQRLHVLTDYMAYAGVVAYANSGRNEDAVAFFDLYVDEVAKGRISETLAKAKTIVDVLRRS